SENWSLLSPGKREVAYNDEGWIAYENERREWLARTNAKARADKRAEHSAYWATRREAAREWLTTAKEVDVPALPAGYPANNKIDHFIADRIVQVESESKAAGESKVNYFEQI